MRGLEGVYNYTWSMFEKDVKVICKLVDFTNYDYFCGIAKGGLPLLVKLVNITKKPYIIIKCESYRDRVREKIEIETIDNFPKGRALLLEDIADTGSTLEATVDRIKFIQPKCEVETLTLFYKPHSVVVPEWYLHEVENHQWINFPWE